MDNYTFKALMECDDFSDIMYQQVALEFLFSSPEKKAAKEAAKKIREKHMTTANIYKEAKALEKTNPKAAKKKYMEIINFLTKLKKEAQKIPDDGANNSSREAEIREIDFSISSMKKLMDEI